jgi:hypothetical protein
MNPDLADNFPHGAYQEGFEKMFGNCQFTGAPVSNTPAQGAQIYEKIMACTPGLGLPPIQHPNPLPPQVMALYKEVGRVTAEMNDIKRDLGGAYSALSDIQTNMGTLKGNLDVLHDELGGKINTLRKEVDSTLCKFDGNLNKTMGSLTQELNENLNNIMGSFTQKLDMLCALVPQGQGSMGSNSTLDDSNRGSPRGFAQHSVPNQGLNPSPPGAQSGTLAPSPVQHSTPYTAQLCAQGKSVPPSYHTQPPQPLTAAAPHGGHQSSVGQTGINIPMAQKWGYPPGLR